MEFHYLIDLIIPNQVGKKSIHFSLSDIHKALGIYFPKFDEYIIIDTSCSDIVAPEEYRQILNRDLRRENRT